MGCKAPREGHCEACTMQDKSDTLGLCLGLCLSRSQRKQLLHGGAPCVFIMLLFVSRLVATCFAQWQSMIFIVVNCRVAVFENIFKQKD